MAKRCPFEDMRHPVDKVFIAFGGCFELRIDEALFQPDIIFFVDDAQQAFCFMRLVEQCGQLLPGNSPDHTVFHQLYIFYRRRMRNKTVQGSNEVILKPEPVGNLFAIDIIIPSYGAFFQEIKTAAIAAFFKEVIVPGKPYPFKCVFQCAAGIFA